MKWSIGVSALALQILSSLTAQAATTGFCQETAVATLWNRSPLAITQISSQTKVSFDYGYSLPTAIPAFGGRFDGSLYLPDTVLWAATALDRAKASGKVNFKFEGTKNGKPVSASVVLEIGVFKGSWTPNGKQIAIGATKLAVGVAAEKTSTAASGALSVMKGLIGSKSKDGMYLRVAEGNYSASGEKTVSHTVYTDKHDLTSVAVGDLAVVILPFASDCPHAGWVVTFMPLQELKDSDIMYQ